MNCYQNSLVDIQGHRGCRGLYPENSLPAFKKAIELGVNTLELDIAITKDNKVVVSHEPYMNPKICMKPNGEDISTEEGKQFNLYNMTYNEIRAFDCGKKDHPDFPSQEKLPIHKPLLSEVFTLVKIMNAKINFNIEIKSKPEYYDLYTPKPHLYVTLVLEAISSSGFSDRVNLQSFDVSILEAIKQQSPDMPVALLVDENEVINDKLKELSFSPEIISPYFKLLSREHVLNLQSLGYKVIPWTVNTKVDMQAMIDLKVDGIITDYPDILLELVN